MNIVYVAIGGALGTLLRYWVMLLAGRTLGINFPYGTLIINITGSFVMGIVIGLLAKFSPSNAQDIRLFVAVGILGGYTTFSTFALDAVSLLEEGRLGSMAVYVLASVITSILAVFIGLVCIRGITA